MRREVLSELSLTLPDIGLGAFSSTCVTVGDVESRSIVSFKGHFVSRYVMSGSAHSVWHLAGWPDRPSDVGAICAAGDMAFVGDADPSSIVQYLMLRSVVEDRFGQHGNGIRWVGVDSEWIQFVRPYLAPAWSIESLSIAMQADEVAAWRELRRELTPSLSQWLGHELMDWLDRGRKFEVEAFAYRNNFFINYQNGFQEFIARRG